MATAQRSPVIGIDLGTTNSVIAVLEDGAPRAIAIDGHLTMPSVVLYRGDDVVVGREARNLEYQHAECTISSVKRKMGSEHRYSIAGSEIRPEAVSAEILKALCTGAQRDLGLPVREVVITVPAYFDDAQRRATLTAAERAGLHVLRLVNEPTSASLVYAQIAAQPADTGSPAADDSEYVLIYDLGGGTFDVSVLEVFDGIREVKATAGNSALGGDDFDERLVRRLIDSIDTKQDVDPRSNPRALARLRRVAEETKAALSTAMEVEVREEFLLSGSDGEPIHLHTTVTRTEFEEAIEPLIRTTVALTRQVIDDARLELHQVARICLVGGSTRIPLVRRLLTEAFEVSIHEEIDPDLGVALGAALQAGICAGVETQRILVDVASHSLGVLAAGPDDFDHPLSAAGADTFVPLIPRNTVVPAERTRELYTAQDEQAMVQVEVFQGEGRRCSLNRRVGSFRYELVPGPQGSPVHCRFEYDLDGVVRVSVSQPGVDSSKTVAFTVSDASEPETSAAEDAQIPEGALERRARVLEGTLGQARRDELAGLLARVREVGGDARAEAEDALLDFFLEHEPDVDETDETDETDEADEADE